MIPETVNQKEAKAPARISLCGMLRLIRVDILRGVNNVGFLVGRLICRTNFIRIKFPMTLGVKYNHISVGCLLCIYEKSILQSILRTVDMSFISNTLYDLHVISRNVDQHVSLS